MDQPVPMLAAGTVRSCYTFMRVAIEFLYLPRGNIAG
jgi:hypothetical protein